MSFQGTGLRGLCCQCPSNRGETRGEPSPVPGPDTWPCLEGPQAHTSPGGNQHPALTPANLLVQGLTQSPGRRRREARAQERRPFHPEASAGGCSVTGRRGFSAGEAGSRKGPCYTEFQLFKMGWAALGGSANVLNAPELCTEKRGRWSISCYVDFTTIKNKIKPQKAQSSWGVHARLILIFKSLLVVTLPSEDWSGISQSQIPTVATITRITKG